jgi:hypothetical protein
MNGQGHENKFAVGGKGAVPLPHQPPNFVLRRIGFSAISDNLPPRNSLVTNICQPIPTLAGGIRQTRNPKLLNSKLSTFLSALDTPPPPPYPPLSGPE